MTEDGVWHTDGLEAGSYWLCAVATHRDGTRAAGALVPVGVAGDLSGEDAAAITHPR